MEEQLQLEKVNQLDSLEKMSVPRGLLLGLGFLLITAGVIMVLGVGLPYNSAPVFVFGLFLGLAGIILLVSGICMTIKNLQVTVPGHFLLHPRTGTRFSPQQAISIQRYLSTEQHNLHHTKTQG